MCWQLEVYLYKSQIRPLNYLEKRVDERVKSGINHGERNREEGKRHATGQSIIVLQHFPEVEYS